MNEHMGSNCFPKKIEFTDEWFSNITNVTVDPHQLENELAMAVKQEGLEAFILGIYIFTRKTASKRFELIMILVEHVLDSAPRSFAKSNARNFLSIMEIIYANVDKLLPKSTRDIDTHCEAFKELCRIPIYMISGKYTNCYSGVYALFVYYKHYSKNFPQMNFQWHYGLQKDVPEDERKMAPRYYDQERIKIKRKIFFENLPSYLSKFEKELSLSMSSLPKGQKSSLWEMFDIYGYATHDIAGVKKGLDLFKLLRELSSQNAIRVLSQGFINAMPERFSSVLFFLTVLKQKINESDRVKIESLSSTISGITTFMYIFAELIPLYYQKLVVSDQLAGLQFAEKYHELQKDFMTWIEQRLISPLEATLTNEKISMPVVEVTDETLHKIVFWRMDMILNHYYIGHLRNSMLFRSESFERGERLRMYLASHPTEPIGVSTWDGFKNKYRHQLDLFFPEKKEKELRKSWMYSMVALLCYIYDLSGLSFNKLKFNKIISEESLKIYSDNISSFTSQLTFVMMYISMYPQNVMAEMKGKNTIFFHGLTDKVVGKGTRMKTLPELIHFFKTQYTSDQKPNDYGLLSLYLSRWILEQTEGFLLTETERNLFRRLRICFCDRCEKIICAENLETCEKEADLFYTWMKDSLKEVRKKVEEIKSSQPDIPLRPKQEESIEESRKKTDTSAKTGKQILYDVMVLFDEADKLVETR